MEPVVTRRDRPGLCHQAVKFDDTDDSLGLTVADFLEPALKAPMPALVIATAPHPSLISKERGRRRLDLTALESGRFVRMVDAEVILDRFMVAAEPDSAEFQATITQLIDEVCEGRRACPVRAYGEMVDVLWRRANPEGALRLEVLWNQIAADARLSLLCGYSVGNFYKEVASRPMWQAIRDQHDHVMDDGQEP